jgi:hypothetical protein
MEVIMDVQIYKFPTMENPKAVEVKYCELLNAQRRGETLPEEVVNWMDSANTWLMELK